jgi:hypothetical protein
MAVAGLVAVGATLAPASGRRGRAVHAVAILAWPALFAVVDLFVFVHYVWPHRGL